jgi:hypothetical protein
MSDLTTDMTKRQRIEAAAVAAFLLIPLTLYILKELLK